MLQYLDRIQEILLAQEPQADPSKMSTSASCIPYPVIFDKRVKILQSMTKAGCSCVSRGVELRKQAKVQQEDADTWKSFVFSSECIDCFMALRKVVPKGAGNSTVEKAVIDMLDCAEALKKEL